MDDLTKLAAHFGKLAAGGYRSNLSPLLGMMGQAVKKEIEKEIGEYQSGIGGYPATAPLADATIEIKTREGLGKGGDPDTPLWATGEFHDSIQIHKDMNELSVEIGSDVDHVVYSELGTSKEPPRPVMGPSALRAVPPLLPEIEAAALMGIQGGIWGGLGVEGVVNSPMGPTANIKP